MVGRKTKTGQTSVDAVAPRLRPDPRRRGWIPRMWVTRLRERAQHAQQTELFVYAQNTSAAIRCQTASNVPPRRRNHPRASECRGNSRHSRHSRIGLCVWAPESTNCADCGPLSAKSRLRPVEPHFSISWQAARSIAFGKYLRNCGPTISTHAQSRPPQRGLRGRGRGREWLPIRRRA